MPLSSRLKLDSSGMLLTVVFYAFAGVTFLGLLALPNPPPQLGILGVLSLSVAYGVQRKRGWAIWLVVMLFFVATTFSLLMTYYYLLNDYLRGLGTMAYLILTWVFTAYTVAKRRTLTT